jgi:hypothetical protein
MDFFSNLGPFEGWLVPALGLGLAAITIAVRGARTRRNAAAGATAVSYELRLPSKWAAELTQRTLDNQGTSSVIAQGGKSWICRVTVPQPGGAAHIEQTCKRLHQIAAARGGACVAHRIRTAAGIQVFEH